MKELIKEIDKLQDQINSYKPLSENMINQIKEYYRIGLVYSSNALEGNTLTESETKVILEDGLTVNGKPLRDHLEATGLSKSYDFMWQLSKKQEITEEDIKQLHKIFYKQIDESNAGVYRKTEVIITGSKYPTTKPSEIKPSIKQMIERFNKYRKEMHPIEFAAIAHKEFVFIHPFIDGNGRVARLLMNLILIQEGYNIAIIPPIMRPEYIRTLELAHKDDTKFKELIANMLKETQKDYLRLIT